MAAGGLAAFLYACPFPAGEKSKAMWWSSDSNHIGAIFLMDLKDTGIRTRRPAGIRAELYLSGFRTLSTGAGFRELEKSSAS